MPRITELWAWVMADEGPDDEGVPAMLITGRWMPLMGADADRAESLRTTAMEMAAKTGKPIKLIRSTGIEVVEEFKPDA